MKDIEVNGAHITDESAEILKQWQVKTEPVSACYIRVIEETIDDLTDEGGERLLCPFRPFPFFSPLQ